MLFNKFIFLVFFIFFNVSNSNATNIVTINLDKILNENIQFQNYLEKISEHKEKNKKLLDSEEKNLLLEKNEIKDLEEILSESEIDKYIYDFNLDIKDFTEKIKKFNTFYINNLEVNEAIIFDKILYLLKEISLLKNYDIVIEQKNFIIANQKIDISNNIINELNKINFKFIMPND